MAQDKQDKGNRRTSLEQARQLVQNNQLDRAIEAYELLAFDNPSDWVLRNTLGDLLIRVGQIEQGVQQFLKAAQIQADAGFSAQATGLLKKALRASPRHTEARNRLDALTDARFGRPVTRDPGRTDVPTSQAGLPGRTATSAEQAPEPRPAEPRQSSAPATAPADVPAPRPPASRTRPAVFDVRPALTAQSTLTAESA